MRHLHSQAHERGLKQMYADVSLTARPVFEHWGFQVEQAQSVTVRGAILQNFRMSKVLPAGS
jgi:putative acetyltransferase